ncbi:hypothetical protein CBM2598_U70012 [Cupriavidus taiwanensis]|nr:hypothetical protein CBM2598_U70012 [Cupriavidus taiwanensis]
MPGLHVEEHQAGEPWGGGLVSPGRALARFHLIDRGPPLSLQAGPKANLPTGQRYFVAVL